MLGTSGFWWLSASVPLTWLWPPVTGPSGNWGGGDVRCAVTLHAQAIGCTCCHATWHVPHSTALQSTTSARQCSLVCARGLHGSIGQLTETEILTEPSKFFLTETNGNGSLKKFLNINGN